MNIPRFWLFIKRRNNKIQYVSTVLQSFRVASKEFQKWIILDSSIVTEALWPQTRLRFLKKWNVQFPGGLFVYLLRSAVVYKHIFLARFAGGIPRQERWVLKRAMIPVFVRRSRT